MKLPRQDRETTILRYSKRYQEHGYAPETLGWNKGRQDLRFDVLTSHYHFSGKHILDVGCGFGDLNRVLRQKFGDSYHYLGVDLVEDLVVEARAQYQGEQIEFLSGDFLEIDLPVKFDYAISSGVFNHQLENIDNYEFIESSIARALELCRDGIAFDFLSDKVDYRHDHTFHSSPERILEIAYRHSRNVILRNDYMPFEFSIFIFKDDSFAPEDAVFQRFKNQHCNETPPNG